MDSENRCSRFLSSKDHFVSILTIVILTPVLISSSDMKCNQNFDHNGATYEVEYEMSEKIFHAHIKLVDDERGWLNYNFAMVGGKVQKIKPQSNRTDESLIEGLRKFINDQILS